LGRWLSFCCLKTRRPHLTTAKMSRSRPSILPLISTPASPPTPGQGHPHLSSQHLCPKSTSSKSVPAVSYSQPNNYPTFPSTTPYPLYTTAQTTPSHTQNMVSHACRTGSQGETAWSFGLIRRTLVWLMRYVLCSSNRVACNGKLINMVIWSVDVLQHHSQRYRTYIPLLRGARFVCNRTHGGRY
jgi:hypothetical protein